MMEPASDAPTKRRSGWRMLGLIVLGMVLLTIGGGFWWYHDDGDLEAIRAAARQRGYPATWSEVGLEAADPNRRRIWARLSQLSDRVRSFDQLPSALRKSEPYRAFGPIPDAMRLHHQMLDQGELSELMILLDQLGDQPLVLHVSMTLNSSLPEINIRRNLLRLLQERLALADATEVPVLARRMLAFCRNCQTDTLIHMMFRDSFINISLGTISSRLAEIKATDKTIADDIQKTTKAFVADLGHAMEGEFVGVLETLALRERDHGFAESDDWFIPLVTRAGRRGMLHAQLDAMDTLKQGDLPTHLAWVRRYHAETRVATGRISSPTWIVQGLFMPTWPTAVEIVLRSHLRGQLIAAEIRGAPWPTDLFDPTGSPLRPIIRDGRVIAAYSVDIDGVDQSGNEKTDRIFPLYAKP